MASESRGENGGWFEGNKFMYFSVGSFGFFFFSNLVFDLNVVVYRAMMVSLKVFLLSLGFLLKKFLFWVELQFCTL